MTATAAPRATWLLIGLVLAVAVLVLALYPQAERPPPEGRVLAQFRFLEPVGAGFFIRDNFTVDDDYERITLTYNITQAYFVRAAVVAPDGSRHEAEAHTSPEGADELLLDVLEPASGVWGFELWTLDEPERQGRIDRADFHILGIGGSNMSAG